MTHLPSLLDRLNNPKISKIEIGQRQIFSRLIADTRLRQESKALSVSCGDGIWDYLALQGNFGLGAIDATDIVECPVKPSDQQLLRTHGAWRFHRVQPDSRLPFDDGFFDLVFHQDVIEHTERPYSFMREQCRVLRGGTVIVGTPNLLRPMNCLKALMGKLHFPALIGRNEEIGNYVHVQEFHAMQLKLLLEEAGFTNVMLYHVYFGLSMSNICFSLLPKGSIGKTFAHFLMAKGVKA